MYHRTNLIYYYDGSFEGLLCCVYRAVYEREDPLSILPEHQPSLLCWTPFGSPPSGTKPSGC